MNPAGQHFDPRTVQLKFALDGENGVFLPVVLDLRDGVLHWLDVHAKGEFEMNNVETSSAAITKICPRADDLLREWRSDFDVRLGATTRRG